jgi:hypothetical protein
MSIVYYDDGAGAEKNSFLLVNDENSRIRIQIHIH